MFGVGNFGDELFSLHLVETAHRLGLAVPAITTSSERISRQTIALAFETATGSDACNFAIDSFRILRRMKRFDAVAIGGGGLFNDVFHPFSVLSYAWIASACVVNGKPLWIHGIEVGCIRSRYLRWLTQQVLGFAVEVSCRDAESVRRIYALNSRCQVCEQPDLAHGYLYRWFMEHPPVGESRALINSLRLHHFDPDRFGQLVSDLHSSHRMISIYDENTSYVHHPAYGLLRDEHIDPRMESVVQHVLDLIRRSETVASERLHVTMAALHSGCTVIPIVTVQKVRQLLMQMPAYQRVISLRPDWEARQPVELSESEAEELREKLSLQSQACLDRRLATDVSSHRPGLGSRFKAVVLLPIIVASVLIYKIRISLQSWPDDRNIQEL